MLSKFKKTLYGLFRPEQWRVSLLGPDAVYSRNWSPSFDEAIQFCVAEVDHDPETLNPKPETVAVELSGDADDLSVVIEKRLVDGRLSVSVKGAEAQLESFPIVDSLDKSVTMLFELYSCVALEPSDAKICTKLRTELRKTRL
jgi:hypothetical protein